MTDAAKPDARAKGRVDEMERGDAVNHESAQCSGLATTPRADAEVVAMCARMISIVVHSMASAVPSTKSCTNSRRAASAALAHHGDSGVFPRMSTGLCAHKHAIRRQNVRKGEATEEVAGVCLRSAHSRHRQIETGR